MAKDIQAQLQSRIQAFTAELADLMNKAAQDAVADALRTSSRGAPARGGKAGKKAGKRAGKKTAKKGTAKRGRPKGSVTGGGAGGSALDERLFREIKKESGRRLEEIAAAMGIDSKKLKLPARRLVADKRVKKSGQARGTRYRA